MRTIHKMNAEKRKANKEAMKHIEKQKARWQVRIHLYQNHIKCKWPKHPN